MTQTQKQLSRVFVELYRRVLTVNRQLPPDLRTLGDKYAREEFRRHKDAVDQIQAQQFIAEWNGYVNTMDQQLNTSSSSGGAGGLGRSLDTDDVGKLSDEQLGQLFELHQEVVNPSTPKDGGEGAK